MKRTAILFFALVIVITACTKKQEQPNIVFVFADQLRSFELSCYGGTNIQTPNIDRLAEEGVRMTHAFSTYPICSPYRAMMLTGLYPMRNGMTNNDHPLRPNLVSLADACNEAGYHTAYIGKWHLDGRGRTNYIPPERREGFQFFQALECTHNYFNSQYYDNDSDEPKFWEGYDAQSQTESAINYIRNRNTEQPFFLMLSWGPPHDPYIAPEEYMEKVNPSTIELRKNLEERATADKLLENPRFDIPERFRSVRKRCLRILEDEAAIREMTAGYLASTLALDDYLGDLIHALEEEGVLDHTIIVFTSDHGDHLGSHRFWGKDTPFEESISVPFLVRYPEKIPASSVSDELFAPIDIMPSLLGLAGVGCPDVDGKDMSQVMNGEKPDTRDAILLMGMTHFNNATMINGMDTWRGVRTKQYTYAQYEDGTDWLLYDNNKDPFQMNNLAGNPDFIEVVSELSEKLDHLLMEAGDAEDTKALYDLIIEENPKRKLVLEFREMNPDHPGM